MKVPAIKGFDEAAFNKYLKNTGWLMIARVASMGIKILVSIELSNYLLKTKLGIYSFPTAFCTFFIAAAALGLDGFVTRELLRKPEKKDLLLGTAFFLKLAGGLTVLPLIYLTYTLLNNQEPIATPLSYVLTVGLTAAIQAFNIIESYFQSRTQAKYIMRVQVSANLISAATKMTFILLGLDIAWFIGALLFDAVILASGYLLSYQKHGGSVWKWTFDRRIAGYLLSKSWPLAFSAILIYVYMRIDQLMIERYLGVGAMGIYTNVVMLAEAWYFIPVAIVTSVFPAIMNARRDDPVRYIRRLQDLYDLMVWVGLSAAISVSIFAPLIFDLLLNDEFAPGAPILSVHIWSAVFVFLSTASGQYLIAEGLVKLTLVRNALGAVVNVVLNIFWIPKYGIMGAAYATLIAYIVNNFWILLLPRTRQQGIMMLKSLFLISLAEKLRR
ncbi:flippase [Pedobacter faecalis]|uniref:flippase n=1 Tax=Pedobacter faecalis TaxID=3041495 RepID=UPI002549F221|nr:flippase [Pedobacter sp. ELA7]